MTLVPSRDAPLTAKNGVKIRQLEDRLNGEWLLIKICADFTTDEIWEKADLTQSIVKFGYTWNA